MDLSANGGCDENEPHSQPTAADGSWQISNLKSDDLGVKPTLIAVVPATAVDADKPEEMIGQQYLMSAASDGNGVISPITTMIEAGVAAGLRRNDALTAVAAQTGVPTDQLTENYTQDDSAHSRRLADFAAMSIVPQLQAGKAPLVEAPATDLGPSYAVSAFRFDDNANYFIRALSTNGQFVNGLSAYQVTYYSLMDGVAQDSDSFFGNELFPDDSGGWSLCNSTQAGQFSGGNPRRVRYCGTDFVQIIDNETLEGSSMQDAALRLARVNGESNWSMDKLLLADAVFPSGAQLQSRKTRRTIDSGRYRLADGAVKNFTSVAQLVAAYPLPAGKAAGVNTVSIGQAATALADTPELRVAFDAGTNTVRYYGCNVSLISCNEIGTGAYQIEPLNGANVLALTQVPWQASVHRIFIERNGAVWPGYRQVPVELGESLRLNDVAFRALAAQLGLTLPTVLAEVRQQ